MGTYRSVWRPRGDPGFTLIEMLIVMGIIVILVGILLPSVWSARRHARKNQAATAIQNLRMAIESYHGAFGDFPPSTLRDIGLPVNRTNDGIESLVACISTTRKGGPFHEFEEDKLKNADRDKIPDFNASYLKKGEAYEYVDPWGNPYIYFHNRDYANPEIASKYGFPEGKTVKATPSKSPKTGNWHGYESFQLWSAGPDGKNDNGGGDDITSWETY